MENVEYIRMGLNFVHGTKLKFIGFSIVTTLKEKPRATQFPEGSNNSYVNTNSYVGLLQCCIGKTTLVKGKGANSHILKNGAEEVAGLSIGNHLLHMYYKYQNVEDVHQVFKKMQDM